MKRGTMKPARRALILGAAVVILVLLLLSGRGLLRAGAALSPERDGPSGRQAGAVAPTVTIPRMPGISLLKNGVLDMTVVAPRTEANPGDKILYSFTVTNVGTETLVEVSVTDPKISVKGGPIASLEPGVSNSGTFSGSYTLTQADINAGKVDNTATATGIPPGAPQVADSDSETVIIPRPPGTTTTTRALTTTTTRAPTTTATTASTTTTTRAPTTTAITASTTTTIGAQTTTTVAQTTTTVAPTTTVSSPTTVTSPPASGAGLSTTLIAAIVAIAVAVIAIGIAIWQFVLRPRSKQGAAEFCGVCGKPAPGGVCSGCQLPTAQCSCPRSKILKEGERLCTKCGLFKIVGANCAGCGKVESECVCLEPTAKEASPDPLKGLNISKGCKPDKKSN